MNSPTDRDPFAFAGHADEGDARVLALFQDWLAACREADGADGEDFEAAVDRCFEIEAEIAATPGGPAALAIKAYLSQRLDDGRRWTPANAMFRCPALLDGDPDISVSMLRDAALLVPELAELAAPVIHEDAVLIDADIEVQWCREINGIDAAELLPAALDRIARTPAKTDRGRAIKAKHAEAPL